MRTTFVLLLAAALAVAGGIPQTAEGAGLNAGDIVVGNNGSTVTISVVNPQTRIKTVVCTSP